MWLITGLGNPGPDYAMHRHNIGFLVLDELRRRFGGSVPVKKFGSDLCQADRQGVRLYLQKPQEYMNVSGQSVQRVLVFYRIEVDHLLVIHDEIDLPLGRLRVKVGGGHGGHNGLRSISTAIGPVYNRIRCGVGRPQSEGGREGVVSHVLSPFRKAEQAEVDLLIQRAADAVEAVLDHGATFAMNKYNGEP